MLPPSEQSPLDHPEIRDGPFSTAGTVLSAAMLALCISLIAWLELSIPPLARVSDPERALALTISRTMDLEEALANAPAWERTLYEISTGGMDELAQSLAWYEELAQHSDDPLVSFHLAILQAESGRLDEVRRTMEKWDRRPQPYPTFKRLLTAGYVGPRPPPDAATLLEGQLAEALPAGWFYDRLATRLAARGGHRALLAATEQELGVRAGELFGRYRLLASVDLFVLIVGTVALAVVFRRRADAPHELKVGVAPVPPLWRGRIGVAVLLRGGAIGAGLTVALLFMNLDNPTIRLLVSPIVHLPLLVLAYRFLLRPAGVGFRDGLGLWPRPEGWRRLLKVVPALLAAAIIGEWVISAAGESLHLTSHWTEWFDQDLVWGSRATVAAALVDYVVFAPFFEEIVFRGLIFSTFRRKFGWAISATASATIFSVLHGYGLLGFASVLWSGVLWAWAYEKTGSLLPGMVAHAVNNGLVVVGILVLLRMP